jgi:hypothetical protein
VRGPLIKAHTVSRSQNHPNDVQLTIDSQIIESYAVLDSSELWPLDTDCLCLSVTRHDFAQFAEVRGLKLEAADRVNGEFRRIGSFNTFKSEAIKILLGKEREPLDATLFEEFDGVDQYVFTII